MFYQTIIWIAIILTILLLCAHLADVVELKNFRENLLPGTKVIIELDTGDKVIATVTKIFYNGSIDESFCEVNLVIDEVSVTLTCPINSIYKPNNYRI